MNWTYTVLLICLSLAVFVLWREVQRESKRHLAIRIIAVLLAIAGLACIILPITYQSTISLDDKGQAVLLTEGFSTDSLSRFANNRIYTISKKVKKEYPKATLIGNAADLLNQQPAVTKLNIFGYGLEQETLAQLGNLPVKFYPVKVPAGVGAINWNQQLKTGEKLSIQGTFNNTSATSSKVVLTGLGTALDSAMVNGNSTSNFDLKATPRHAGRAVYRLLTINGKDTLANESIPVEVNTVKPLNVLILAAAPDFENKFLKNWLSANGYGVAVRSMISKDKFSQEFANIAGQPLGNLTASLISKFDVVIGDLDVFKHLNAAESSALKQQVQQKGTGIIVRADSTTHSPFWLQQSFPLNKASTATQVIAALNIHGQSNPTTKLLLDPVYIGTQNYTQPLVTDQQQHVMASSTLMGSGKEVFTTLIATHSWMLSGNENDYTALWSLLITKAAKSTPVAEQWSVMSPVPAANGHARLKLETSAPQPEIKVNQDNISSSQKSDLPFAYVADYWPAHTGWQQVQQGSAAPQWWYAYPQSEWMGLKYSKALYDTRAYAALFSGASSSVTKQIHQTVRIPVSKIYFYMLLLAACTYLWAEAKFNRN